LTVGRTNKGNSLAEFRFFLIVFFWLPKSLRNCSHYALYMCDVLTKQVAIILPLRVAGSLCCYKTAQFIAQKVQIFISGNKFIWRLNLVRKFMKQLSVLAIFF